VRQVTLRSLRHYNASTMIEGMAAARGVNLKKLQALMGRASFQVTMDTHGHLVSDAKHDLANGLADMAFNLVLMPPPRPALSLPRADGVSGSAARVVAMTRSRLTEPE
jgi:hypothetical protein